MINFRPFLNTDHPLLIEIWRRQQPFRGVVESVSRSTLDSHVFSKPYFDRFGLIVALEGETPLGFVHAGFGPNAELSDLDPTIGVISQLKVVSGPHEQEVAKGLIDQACAYLSKHGSTEVRIGSVFPFAPFYLGLYGGSRLPGLMEEDKATRGALEQNGFTETDQVHVLSRTLAGFRPVVDREQMAVRRQFQVTPVADPMESSWWESCTLGLAERDSFRAFVRGETESCGSLTFWDIEPLASEWGVAARGIYDLKIREDHRRRGLATFLLGEAIRHLTRQGVGLVEAQVDSNNEAALEVFRKLGFEKTTGGIIYSKPIN